MSLGGGGGGGGGGNTQPTAAMNMSAGVARDIRNLRNEKFVPLEDDYFERLKAGEGEISERVGLANADTQVQLSEAIRSNAQSGRSITDLGTLLSKTQATTQVGARDSVDASDREGKLRSLNVLAKLPNSAVGGLGAATALASERARMNAQIEQQERDSSDDLLGTILGAGTAFGAGKFRSHGRKVDAGFDILDAMG